MIPAVEPHDPPVRRRTARQAVKNALQSCIERTCLSNHLFWRLPARNGADRARPTIALTFDDGPHPENTPRILDILEEYNARATFFAIGKHARRHPELARRIIHDGHTLGCHTNTHVDLSRVGFRKTLEECRTGQETLQDIAGVRISYLRPPWGRFNAGTLVAAKRYQMRVALWSLDSLDHRHVPADEIFYGVTRSIHGGDIVLAHDDARNTVEALPRVLRFLTEHGWRCANIQGSD